MGIFSVSKEDVEACSNALLGIKTGSSPERVLREIEPTILKMRRGDVVFSQISKLVNAGNIDRAGKLLRVAPRQRAIASKFIGIFASLALIAPILLGIPLITRCNGAYEPAMAALNNCRAATDLLGAPVKQFTVGPACGKNKTDADHGNAHWQFPVSGSKGWGRFQYTGSNEGNGWHLNSAELIVGDRIISIWPCEGASLEGTP